jgi:hypothetical protein
VIITFVVSNHFQGPLHAQSVKNTESIATTGTLPPDLSQVRVPENMGKIEEVYAGKSSQTVVLVQDAHAIPDAQKSIAALISFFQKQYGINVVALEGASTELDPEMFRSFPDKKILKSVFKEYNDKGHLAGGVAAAIFSGKQETGDGESHAKYHGIEDWDLYQEGIGYYLTAMGKQKVIGDRLSAIGGKLKKEKSDNYPEKLLAIDSLLESFESNAANLMEVLKKLAAVKAPEQGSELALLLEAEGAGKESGSRNIGKTDDAEVKQIAQQVKRYLEKHQGLSPKGIAPSTSEIKTKLASFNEKYQDYQTSRMTPEAFALFMKELVLEYRLPIKVSKSLGQMMRKQKRMEDIKGTKLFDDFEKYAEDVKASLFENDAQRDLNRRSRELALLDRFNKLELTQEDWNALSGDNAYRIPDIEKEALQKSFESHWAFYRNAIQRDHSLFNNLIRLLRPNSEGRLQNRPAGSQSDMRNTIYDIRSSALAVAGGFHTRGLTKLLRENGISYVLLMPAIKEIPEETSYRDQMLGNVPWKNYFEVRDGKVNLYEAFVRSTRDRLLRVDRDSVIGDRTVLNDNRSTIHDSQFTLKFWRDEILRDLASQNRLADAGQYTKFIDEATPKGRELEARRKNLMEKVEQFISGLRGLKADNQLSEANILRILKTTTVPTQIAAVLESRIEMRQDLAAAPFGEVAEPALRREVRDQTRTTASIGRVRDREMGAADLTMVSDLEVGIPMQSFVRTVAEILGRRRYERTSEGMAAAVFLSAQDRKNQYGELSELAAGHPVTFVELYRALMKSYLGAVQSRYRDNPELETRRRDLVAGFAAQLDVMDLLIPVVAPANASLKRAANKLQKHRLAMVPPEQEIHQTQVLLLHSGTVLSDPERGLTDRAMAGLAVWVDRLSIWISNFSLFLRQGMLDRMRTAVLRQLGESVGVSAEVRRGLLSERLFVEIFGNPPASIAGQLLDYTADQLAAHRQEQLERARREAMTTFQVGSESEKAPWVEQSGEALDEFNLYELDKGALVRVQTTQGAYLVEGGNSENQIKIWKISGFPGYYQGRIDALPDRGKMNKGVQFRFPFFDWGPFSADFSDRKLRPTLTFNRNETITEIVKVVRAEMRRVSPVVVGRARAAAKQYLAAHPEPGMVEIRSAAGNVISISHQEAARDIALRRLNAEDLSLNIPIAQYERMIKKARLEKFRNDNAADPKRKRTGAAKVKGYFFEELIQRDELDETRVTFDGSPWVIFDEAERDMQAGLLTYVNGELVLTGMSKEAYRERVKTLRWPEAAAAAVAAAEQPVPIIPAASFDSSLERAVQGTYLAVIREAFTDLQREDLIAGRFLLGVSIEGQSVWFRVTIPTAAPVSSSTEYELTPVRRVGKTSQFAVAGNEVHRLETWQELFRIGDGIGIFYMPETWLRTASAVPAATGSESFYPLEQIAAAIRLQHLLDIGFAQVVSKNPDGSIRAVDGQDGPLEPVLADPRILPFLIFSPEQRQQALIESAAHNAALHDLIIDFHIAWASGIALGEQLDAESDPANRLGIQQAINEAQRNSRQALTALFQAMNLAPQDFAPEEAENLAVSIAARVLEINRLESNLQAAQKNASPVQVSKAINDQGPVSTVDADKLLAAINNSANLISAVEAAVHGVDQTARPSVFRVDLNLAGEVPGFGTRSLGHLRIALDAQIQQRIAVQFLPLDVDGNILEAKSLETALDGNQVNAVLTALAARLRPAEGQTVFPHAAAAMEAIQQMSGRAELRVAEMAPGAFEAAVRTAVQTIRSWGLDEGIGVVDGLLRNRTEDQQMALLMIKDPTLREAVGTSPDNENSDQQQFFDQFVRMVVAQWVLADVSLSQRYQPAELTQMAAGGAEALRPVLSGVRNGELGALISRITSQGDDQESSLLEALLQEINAGPLERPASLRPATAVRGPLDGGMGTLTSISTAYADRVAGIGKTTVIAGNEQSLRTALQAHGAVNGDFRSHPGFKEKVQSLMGLTTQELGYLQYIAKFMRVTDDATYVAITFYQGPFNESSQEGILLFYKIENGQLVPLSALDEMPLAQDNVANLQYRGLVQYEKRQYGYYRAYHWGRGEGEVKTQVKLPTGDSDQFYSGHSRMFQMTDDRGRTRNFLILMQDVAGMLIRIVELTADGVIECNQQYRASKASSRMSDYLLFTDQATLEARQLGSNVTVKLVMPLEPHKFTQFNFDLPESRRELRTEEAAFIRELATQRGLLDGDFLKDFAVSGVVELVDRLFAVMDEQKERLIGKKIDRDAVLARVRDYASQASYVNEVPGRVLVTGRILGRWNENSKTLNSLFAALGVGPTETEPSAVIPAYQVEAVMGVLLKQLKERVQLPRTNWPAVASAITQTLDQWESGLPALGAVRDPEQMQMLALMNVARTVLDAFNLSLNYPGIEIPQVGEGDLSSALSESGQSERDRPAIWERTGFKVFGLASIALMAVLIFAFAIADLNVPKVINIIKDWGQEIGWLSPDAKAPLPSQLLTESAQTLEGRQLADDDDFSKLRTVDWIQSLKGKYVQIMYADPAANAFANNIFGTLLDVSEVQTNPDGSVVVDLTLQSRKGPGTFRLTTQYADRPSGPHIFSVKVRDESLPPVENEFPKDRKEMRDQREQSASAAEQARRIQAARPAAPVRANLTPSEQIAQMRAARAAAAGLTGAGSAVVAAATPKLTGSAAAVEYLRARSASGPLPAPVVATSPRLTGSAAAADRIERSETVQAQDRIAQAVRRIVYANGFSASEDRAALAKHPIDILRLLPYLDAVAEVLQSLGGDPGMVQTVSQELASNQGKVNTSWTTYVTSVKLPANRTNQWGVMHGRPIGKIAGALQRPARDESFGSVDGADLEIYLRRLFELIVAQWPQSKTQLTAALKKQMQTAEAGIQTRFQALGAWKRMLGMPKELKAEQEELNLIGRLSLAVLDIVEATRQELREEAAAVAVAQATPVVQKQLEMTRQVEVNMAGRIARGHAVYTSPDDKPEEAALFPEMFQVGLVLDQLEVMKDELGEGPAFAKFLQQASVQAQKGSGVSQISHRQLKGDVKQWGLKSGAIGTLSNAYTQIDGEGRKNNIKAYLVEIFLRSFFGTLQEQAQGASWPELSVKLKTALLERQAQVRQQLDQVSGERFGLMGRISSGVLRLGWLSWVGGLMIGATSFVLLAISPVIFAVVGTVLLFGLSLWAFLSFLNFSKRMADQKSQMEAALHANQLILMALDISNLNRGFFDEGIDQAAIQELQADASQKDKDWGRVSGFSENMRGKLRNMVLGISAYQGVLGETLVADAVQLAEDLKPANLSAFPDAQISERLDTLVRQAKEVVARNPADSSANAILTGYAGRIEAVLKAYRETLRRAELAAQRAAGTAAPGVRRGEMRATGRAELRTEVVAIEAPVAVAAEERRAEADKFASEVRAYLQRPAEEKRMALVPWIRSKFGANVETITAKNIDLSGTVVRNIRLLREQLAFEIAGDRTEIHEQLKQNYQTLKQLIIYFNGFRETPAWPMLIGSQRHPGVARQLIGLYNDLRSRAIADVVIDLGKMHARIPDEIPEDAKKANLEALRDSLSRRINALGKIKNLAPDHAEVLNAARADLAKVTAALTRGEMRNPFENLATDRKLQFNGGYTFDQFETDLDQIIGRWNFSQKPERQPSKTDLDRFNEEMRGMMDKAFVFASMVQEAWDQFAGREYEAEMDPTGYYVTLGLGALLSLRESVIRQHQPQILQRVAYYQRDRDDDTTVDLAPVGWDVSLTKRELQVLAGLIHRNFGLIGVSDPGASFLSREELQAYLAAIKKETPAWDNVTLDFERVIQKQFQSVEIASTVNAPDSFDLLREQAESYTDWISAARGTIAQLAQYTGTYARLAPSSRGKAVTDWNEAERRLSVSLSVDYPKDQRPVVKVGPVEFEMEIDQADLSFTGRFKVGDRNEFQGGGDSPYSRVLLMLLRQYVYEMDVRFEPDFLAIRTRLPGEATKAFIGLAHSSGQIRRVPLDPNDPIGAQTAEADEQDEQYVKARQGILSMATFFSGVLIAAQTGVLPSPDTLNADRLSQDPRQFLPPLLFAARQEMRTSLDMLRVYKKLGYAVQVDYSYEDNAPARAIGSIMAIGKPTAESDGSSTFWLTLSTLDGLRWQRRVNDRQIKVSEPFDAEIRSIIQIFRQSRGDEGYLELVRGLMRNQRASQMQALLQINDDSLRNAVTSERYPAEQFYDHLVRMSAAQWMFENLSRIIKVEALQRRAAEGDAQLELLLLEINNDAVRDLVTQVLAQWPDHQPLFFDALAREINATRGEMRISEREQQWNKTIEEFPARYETEFKPLQGAARAAKSKELWAAVNEARDGILRSLKQGDILVVTNTDSEGEEGVTRYYIQAGSGERDIITYWELDGQGQKTGETLMHNIRDMRDLIVTYTIRDKSNMIIRRGTVERAVIPRTNEPLITAQKLASNALTTPAIRQMLERGDFLYVLGESDIGINPGDIFSVVADPKREGKSLSPQLLREAIAAGQIGAAKISTKLPAWKYPKRYDYGYVFFYLPGTREELQTLVARPEFRKIEAVALGQQAGTLVIEYLNQPGDAAAEQVAKLTWQGTVGELEAFIEAFRKAAEKKLAEARVTEAVTAGLNDEDYRLAMPLLLERFKTIHQALLAGLKDQGQLLSIEIPEMTNTMESKQFAEVFKQAFQDLGVKNIDALIPFAPGRARPDERLLTALRETGIRPTETVRQTGALDRISRRHDDKPVVLALTGTELKGKSEAVIPVGADPTDFGTPRFEDLVIKFEMQMIIGLTAVTALTPKEISDLNIIRETQSRESTLPETLSQKLKEITEKLNAALLKQTTVLGLDNAEPMLNFSNGIPSFVMKTIAAIVTNARAEAQARIAA